MDAFLSAIENHGRTVFLLVMAAGYLLEKLRPCCGRSDEDDE